ncbi:LOB domain-containing protein 29 [Canna indica]|uniref:LOB domain-containing protein 29 n=1 Tax=Canna indica TaxID=4628 RepID=A0AAQ3QEG1_9LILI|nr:LOB domain-containing protein 29 [Canna indica]
MTGFGSPCGACKFLRRKCVRGCVFAPYFCHEQGAAHFAAIHKVFGASNVSKLLAHLPVSDRAEAALTISYEAQARLQDPIYGCVAHIFALQQQVVTLEAQLASLKAQTAQGFAGGSSSCLLNLQAPLVLGNSANAETMLYNGLADSAASFISSQHCEDLPFSFVENDGEDNNSSCAMASLDQIQANARRPTYLDMEDLQSVAFGHLNFAIFGGVFDVMPVGPFGLTEIFISIKLATFSWNSAILGFVRAIWSA